MSLLVCLAFSTWLFAEPYIAVREGLRCSNCHENLTGGGKRNRFGANYGAQALPWKDPGESGRGVPNYLEILENRISFGGDFRASHISTFTEGTSNTNTFQTEKSNLYLQVLLIPDLLSFYLDESIAPGGAQAREIFGLVRLPKNGWLKAGKFVLPYGLRLEDDRAFVREVPGFNFNRPDFGIEFGLEPGNFTMVAALTNGTGGLDDNNAKQLSGSVGYTRERFRIGASAAYNSGSFKNQTVAGIWSGIGWGKFALLGELDWIQDDLDSTDVHQFSSHAELNYLLAQGWNVKVAYQYHDPDRNIPENQRDRVLLGLETTPIRFLQIQVFYRFNQSIPQNKVQNADELQIRLHLYF